MKTALLTISCLLFFFFSYSQKPGRMIYDKTDKYYAGINFDKVDPLENWSYRLMMQTITIDETPKQLGQLMIGRDKPLIDKSIKENGGQWMPFIVFEIYNAKEYDLCLQKSQETRNSSSCKPPMTGGDIFRIGNFVFLNQADCLACSDASGIDYCRPVINMIFSKVDVAKVITVEDIVRQFEIKKAK